MSTVTPTPSTESNGVLEWVPSLPGQHEPVVIDGIEIGQIAVSYILP
jgi:hypothetical protein